MLLFFFLSHFWWKICNVSVMYLLLYVHVCVTRTGWKTRPRPKTVILPIKKSINQSISHVHASWAIHTETNTHFSTSTAINFKEMGFKFIFDSCETVFVRDSGGELQTVGPKAEKELFSKVSRERQGTVSREASRERSYLEGEHRWRRSKWCGGILFW